MGEEREERENEESTCINIFFFCLYYCAARLVYLVPSAAITFFMYEKVLGVFNDPQVCLCLCEFIYFLCSFFFVWTYNIHKSEFFFTCFVETTYLILVLVLFVDFIACRFLSLFSYYIFSFFSLFFPGFFPPQKSGGYKNAILPTAGMVASRTLSTGIGDGKDAEVRRKNRGRREERRGERGEAREERQERSERWEREQRTAERQNNKKRNRKTEERRMRRERRDGRGEKILYIFFFAFFSVSFSHAL